MAQKLLGVIKSPRAWLAALLFAAMIVMLYLIQYPLFSGAFATPFIYVLFYGVIIFLGWLFRGEAEPRRRTNAVWRSVEIFLIAGVIAACAWSVYNDRYFLLGYQGLALLVALGVVFIRKRALRLKRYSKYNSTLCSVICASALVSTALFFAVVRPVTVQGAERMLEREGYGGVKYVAHLGATDRSRAIPAEFAEIPDNLDVFDGQGAYLLRGERGGEQYGLFVNLTRREIAWVIPLSGNEAARTAIELLLE